MKSGKILKAEPVSLPLALPLADGHQGPEIAAALASAAAALAALARAITPAPPALEVLTLPPAPAPGPIAGATVAEIINDFLLAKARAGRSDGYLRTLRYTLAAFAQGRARRPAASVTRQEIDGFLARSKWQAKTKRNALADLNTLFNWSVRRDYLERNPAAGVELARPVEAPPAIHTPDQARAALEAAYAIDAAFGRSLAIRYFAGLRTAEVLRLAEADLLLSQGLINVPAEKSKTRRRRLVEIQPNLAAWLKDRPGALPVRDANTCQWELSKACPPWPKNVARHSFCSYHLAAFESAARTALQAGHSEAMLFAHYRALATKETGLEFFSIRPA